MHAPDPDPSAVARFAATIADPVRRADAAMLDTLFRAVTGAAPLLWAGDMIGYGHYDYTYRSGKPGRWFATGFAPRKAQQVLYVMPGATDMRPILADLGKWKAGKACIHITRLTQVDIDVLATLIRAGLRDLATMWPVSGFAGLGADRDLTP
ncbi:protein of unknown function (DU1801) [Loktanella fryxellensis]|uniref:YdhG-like domain-containing protein n=2 Tax=Loktanella fryxellensis TaxID=245187 RepID=A0A1H8AJ56_9RHOB|nr:protein of unknown function (DU1801) [Loktanella fryxellensis]